MSAIKEKQVTVVLEPIDNKRLGLLCGPLNHNLKQIEAHLDVEIRNCANTFQLNGTLQAINRTEQVIQNLYRDTIDNKFSEQTLHLRLVESGGADSYHDAMTIKLPDATIRGRTSNQRKYIQSIMRHDISFGIGPAGTGKTLLAVACAANALEQQQVKRIVLSRPAVEAGERLGFLPGDMTQKIDPYLRPLQDALFSLLGAEKIERYMAAGRIEMLPLAFMRGRTLSDAFILLDEAQNTTVEQMKMFITRMGMASTMVINGDVTQVDLPNRSSCGLEHVEKLLANEPGVGFTKFSAIDVVRHPLVARIVRAYEAAECNKEQAYADSGQSHTPAI
ncbi:MAG: PhoH family protein [Candidatus Porifericomitaceae bacterium WSBS_2022_MAG_OTU9]